MSHRSGFIAIVGRPNVGKSTLLNRLVGSKVAIVSPKPQTTRRRILGVTTLPDAQLLFYDTAGWHRARSLLNKRMVQDTEGVIADADVVLWVVDALAGLRDDDRYLCDRLRAAGRPTCIAVNKIDRRARAALLPQLAEIGALLPEAEIVPVSALEGENVPKLIEILASLLPEGPRLYDEDTITDQTERKLVEEIIREQIFLQMREEVPYAVGVVIEKFEERDDLAVISAAIHVERKTQKGIVIGAGGARIKEIGRAARLEAEDMLGRRVYLELFVRVNEDWTTDPRRLTEMGL
jgi:GTP-binding protein Era